MSTSLPTLSSVERAIKLFVPEIARTDARREAKEFLRRYKVNPTPFDLRILGYITDNTPKNAFNEIRQNDLNAARRLGLVAA